MLSVSQVIRHPRKFGTSCKRILGMIITLIIAGMGYANSLITLVIEEYWVHFTSATDLLLQALDVVQRFYMSNALVYLLMYMQNNGKQQSQLLMPLQLHFLFIGLS